MGISTFNEQEYVLEPSPAQGTWLDLLRKEVEVKGSVAVNQQGLKVLQVDSIHVIGKEQ